MENNQNKIVYIGVDKLFPHPDNPRKELGDLTELSASIKNNGIMQNLTVVPRSEGGYTVIIGHRRTGAAKLAGLKELPCVIAEMTEQEQIATMLSENMQRSDLTVYEQAQGFQLMFDLGEDVESISEKTGFSKTTVRRRLKLAELDSEELKKASCRQITLDDLDKLSRLDDVATRNRLLNSIGTPNFAYEYKKAITDQEQAKLSEKWRKVLISAGLEEIPYSDAFNNKYRSCSKPYVSCSAVAPDEYVLDDGQEYFAINRGTVYFRRNPTDQDKAKDAEYDLKAAKNRERLNELQEITKQAYELRYEFIMSISETFAKKAIETVTKYNILRDWTGVDNYGWNSGYDCSKISDKEINKKEISTEINVHPYLMFLRHTYLRWADNSTIGYKNYNGQFVENKRLDMIYDFLFELGYEISDEEQALKDGTHKLFID